MLLLLVQRQQLKRLESCAHRDDCRLTVKSQLTAIVAAVVLVGCGESSVDIHDAAYDGNIEAVKQHLDAGTDVNAKGSGGWTPLHYAAYGGHKKIAELLIDNNADVNAMDNIGYIPLHNAANYGHKEVVELLIAAGADVNAKNKNEWTHLSAAAVNGHKDIVELLIAEGADVNENESGGGTPLDWANDKEIADLLRKHGGKTGEELKAEAK